MCVWSFPKALFYVQKVETERRVLGFHVHNALCNIQLYSTINSSPPRGFFLLLRSMMGKSMVWFSNHPVLQAKSLACCWTGICMGHPENRKPWKSQFPKKKESRCEWLALPLTINCILDSCQTLGVDSFLISCTEWGLLWMVNLSKRRFGVTCTSYEDLTWPHDLRAHPHCKNGGLFFLYLKKSSETGTKHFRKPWILFVYGFIFGLVGWRYPPTFAPSRLPPKTLPVCSWWNSARGSSGYVFLNCHFPSILKRRDDEPISPNDVLGKCVWQHLPI